MLATTANTLVVNHDADHLVNFVQGASVILLHLYFVSLLVWKLLGRKLQAVLVKARVAWSSIVHRPREDSGGEGMESFDREQDTSVTNSYPPLLGGSQRPTY